MRSITCPYCGNKMDKNGKTKADKQRWRCIKCGVSTVNQYDGLNSDLKAFLCWLLSKDRQIDMPGGGRSFRRRCKKFWDIWPVPHIIDEVHDVIHIDGIWLAKNVVILIACSKNYILSWHLARGENSQSYVSFTFKDCSTKHGS